MRTFVCLVLAGTLLTSCATVFNRKAYRVHFSSDLDSGRVAIGDSVYRLPASVRVVRSGKPLNVTLSGRGGFTRAYTIKASPTPLAVYGNLAWTYLFPVGYAVDYATRRGFYYGRNVYLSTADTVGVIRPPLAAGYHQYVTTRFPTRAGQTDVVLSLPYVNNFRLHPAGEPVKVNTGFWGISVGVDRYYQASRYVNVSLHAASDIFVPVPAPVRMEGKYERMTTAYLSVTDNFRVGRQRFGYGANVARNGWRLADTYDSTGTVARHQANLALGLTLTTYHQLAERFFVGVIYRPSLVQIHPTRAVGYEHLLSLDVQWKIKLRKAGRGHPAGQRQSLHRRRVW
jgi:hypothetical protein